MSRIAGPNFTRHFQDRPIAGPEIHLHTNHGVAVRRSGKKILVSEREDPVWDWRERQAESHYLAGVLSLLSLSFEISG